MQCLWENFVKVFVWILTAPWNIVKALFSWQVLLALVVAAVCILLYSQILSRWDMIIFRGLEQQRSALYVTLFIMRWIVGILLGIVIVTFIITLILCGNVSNGILTWRQFMATWIIVSSWSMCLIGTYQERCRYRARLSGKQSNSEQTN